MTDRAGLPRESRLTDGGPVNTLSQRLCIWSGVLFVVFLLVGFAIAGFIPPPGPTRSSEEIVALFDRDSVRIRVGMCFVIMGAPLLFTFCAAISVHMKKIEGNFSPLAYAQLTSGGVAAVFFIIPTMFFQALSFRPHAIDPGMVHLVFDFAWLTLLGTPSLAVVQGLVIALCILQDKSPDPVFPRWAGYFNIWVFLLFLPAMFTFFVKTGPFAWNALFVWWIPLTIFAIWFIVMTWLMLRATSNQQRQSASASSPSHSGQ
jgi:hypothetical protein